MSKLPLSSDSRVHYSREAQQCDSRCQTDSSQLKPRVRKCVSFRPSATAYRVIHINDYTGGEIAATWLSAPEKHAIKTSILETLGLMQNDDGNDEGFRLHCSRGLEHLTDEGAAGRSRRRATAINAVLDEQDLQYDNRKHDDQLIADSYSRHTQRSVAAALAVGLADADAIKIIETHDCCLDGVSGRRNHPSSAELVALCIKGTSNLNAQAAGMSGSNNAVFPRGDGPTKFASRAA
jgi:hypothetical protein